MVSKDDLRKLYDSNDADKNGVLSLSEATTAVASVKGDLKNEGTFAADFNGLAKNGEISFENFCKLFKGF
uniref:EF-hand domain-containing protein n=1 Tax=Rhabditophanes sp. KR3021 TaxID=114890 RepID=A0AC35TMJ4_9BILA